MERLDELADLGCFPEEPLDEDSRPLPPTAINDPETLAGNEAASSPTASGGARAEAGCDSRSRSPPAIASI